MITKKQNYFFICLGIFIIAIFCTANLDTGDKILSKDVKEWIIYLEMPLGLILLITFVFGFFAFIFTHISRLIFTDRDRARDMSFIGLKWLMIKEGSDK